jgi:hypothetical protein
MWVAKIYQNPNKKMLKYEKITTKLALRNEII